jgi:hypothetical protein
MAQRARASDSQRVLDLGQRSWHAHLAASLAQGRADLAVAHSAEVVFVR